MNEYREIRSEFYRRLTACVDLPTRPSSQRGMAWRSQVPGIYHSLIVLPYIGSFDHPQDCEHPRPVPRFHLNDMALYDVSKRRKALWGWDGSHSSWRVARQYLELTVTIEECLDFADWIATWARAIDADDSSLILPSPHALEIYAEPLSVSHSYLWTQAAADEHNAYRQRQAERQARRDAMRAARRAALCSDGMAPVAAPEV